MRIKRIYTFMLQTFIPLFLMTFFICLFIVLMQFLWRYVGDLVGKGLGVDVLAELFFYAALTFVPMALPLGILLASLMTFGNLGESLELLAMKASGVSLLRIMRPLTIFMVFLAIGTFFFQDRVLPYANTKMYSILLGIKHKSPELEIPEGVFYKEINNYNIYVDHKDFETGTLHGVTIYIFDGYNIEDAIVTTADSARISMAETGRHLKLTLWNGEQVGTFKENNRNSRSSYSDQPKYRRESFTEKEIYVLYDNDLERADEDAIADRHVGKNLAQLTHSVDSLNQRIDSIDYGYGKRLKSGVYFSQVYDNARNDSAYFATTTGAFDPATDVLATKSSKDSKPHLSLPINLDSIYASLEPSQMEEVVRKAQAKSQNVVSTFAIQQEMQTFERKNINYHAMEIHRKFSLSIACLLFFFIGAPLGAIIRKGGMGVPLITGVLFFIFYYIIDNTGYQAAKEGSMEPWSGIWLSSFVLAPLGIWLTWRAINDSPLFDWDTYKIRFQHFMRWTVTTFKPIIRRFSSNKRNQKKSIIAG